MFSMYTTNQIIGQEYLNIYDDLVELYNLIAPQNTTYQLKTYGGK